MSIHELELNIWGGIREINVLVKITSLGDPGRLSGPPEDCWPPEGAEWEIVKVREITGSETGELDEDELGPRAPITDQEESDIDQHVQDWASEYDPHEEDL